MNENQDNSEQRNLIPENAYSNVSFWERISSKDVMTITSDLFPSIVIVGFISNAIISNEKFCSENFSTVLKIMMFIYTGFMIKAIIHTFLICIQNEESSFSKISLQTMDFLLYLAYYIAVLFAYFAYRGRPDECFMNNTFRTILIFTLVLIGIVNISRHALNIMMIILCFPVMVYYFLRNPRSFYSNFGIDPEIIQNLPAIKADDSHESPCTICTEDIKVGNEILVLKCNHRHFFHEVCIKSWLVRKLSCPICRDENII